jgi:polyhydroxybutyrate depolymerase
MRVRIILVAGPAAIAAIAFGCAGSGVTTSSGSASLDAGASDDGATIPWDDATTPDGGTTSASDASTTCSGKSAAPLDQTLTVMSKGTTRTAHVHVPASYDPKRATPVVLNFHGYTSNAPEEELLTVMTPKADKEGFIVVYPDGLGGSWNAGTCCGTSMSTNVDDVAFVADLLDAMETELCVDTRRVFATGMSNGGFLSHRLACELSTRIAAVAPVAGVLAPPTCDAKRAVPVMHFHGTADMLVPYGGDATMGIPSVADTIAGWAARDGCTGEPLETFRKGDAHCTTHGACAEGAEVTLCTIDNGGHTWPGGTPIVALGNTSTNLSATDAMWTFFLAHPMP